MITFLAITTLVINRQAAAQDGKETAKLPFSMTLTSVLSNGVRTVKAHLVRKENKKKITVDDVKTPFTLYHDEIKDFDAGNATGLISKAGVNNEGDVIFSFPAGFNKLTDTVHKFRFIVKMNGDQKYEDAEEEITVSDAKISIQYSGADSVKTASATIVGWTDSGYKPIAGAGLRLCIKRTFNFLPFGEAGATTGENGEISGDLPLDLPGNMNNTITIAARLEDDENYGTVEVTKDVPWAILPKKNPARGRTLWSGGDNAPWLLVISSLTIITIIWSTIFYLVSLLVKIKKLGKLK